MGFDVSVFAVGFVVNARVGFVVNARVGFVGRRVGAWEEGLCVVGETVTSSIVTTDGQAFLKELSAPSTPVTQIKLIMPLTLNVS